MPSKLQTGNTFYITRFWFLIKFLTFRKVLLVLVKISTQSFDKQEVFTLGCCIFTSLKLEYNVDQYCTVWLEFAKLFDALPRNSDEKSRLFLENEVLTFLMWIVVHLHLASMDISKVNLQFFYTNNLELISIW